MRKNQLFIITPMLFTFGALTGCKGGDTPTSKTLTSISVTPTTDKYIVGYEFTKDDIGSLQATYSDGSTTPIKEGYTSDPALPYTFVDGDVTSGKDFNFTYQGKSASFHVSVLEKKKVTGIKLDKENLTFLTDDKDPLEITATVEPKGASNKKIKWSLDKTDIIKLESSETTSGGVMKVSLCDKATPDEVVITATSDEDASFKATCKVTVLAASEINKFVKLYQPYSDAFQNSSKVYDANQVLMDGAEISSIDYIGKTSSTSRSCVVNKETSIGGGDKELSYLVYMLKQMEQSGLKITCDPGENKIGVQAKQQDGTVMFEFYFNSNGYLTKCTTSGNTHTFTYIGEPHELTEEEKFYSVYKTASNNFQTSGIPYDIDDIDSLTVNGVKVNPTNIKYEISEASGKRNCTLVYDGGKEAGEVIAGYSYTYYEKEDEGIKNVIKHFKDFGCEVEFSSDVKTGESGFKIINEGVEIGEYKFDKNGYLNVFPGGSTGTDRIEIKFKGDPVFNKTKFLSKFNEYKKTFNESTTQYTLEQISNATIKGYNVQSINGISYNGREATLNGKYMNYKTMHYEDFNLRVDVNYITDEKLSTISDEGQFKIFSDGTIQYGYRDRVEDHIQILIVNKFGYINHFEVGDYLQSSEIAINDYFTLDIKDKEEPQVPSYISCCDYEIISGTTNVSVKAKESASFSGTLNIPATIDGAYVTGGTKGIKYTVTEIASEAFLPY